MRHAGDCVKMPVNIFLVDHPKQKITVTIEEAANHYQAVCVSREGNAGNPNMLQILCAPPAVSNCAGQLDHHG